MRDPLAGKATRIIVQEQQADGKWLDAVAISMTRRGPDEAFKTGATGWYGNGSVPIHGRQGSIGISFTETGTKGLGTPKLKLTPEEKLARKSEVSGAAKAYYDADEAPVKSGKRIA